MLLAETILALPRGVLGFPESDSRQPIESDASREHVASGTSCRASPFPRTAPGSPKRARESSTCHAPTQQASKTRSAFLRQVPSTTPLTEARSALSGRHGYLGFAASAPLPTRVHAWLSRARPTPPRLLPRFGLSHMLPVEFCSRKDPRAHLRQLQTPAALMTGKPASTGWRLLLRGHTN
jgi:hypothetical protein